MLRGSHAQAHRYQLESRAIRGAALLDASADAGRDSGADLDAAGCSATRAFTTSPSISRIRRSTSRLHDVRVGAGPPALRGDPPPNAFACWSRVARLRRSGRLELQDREYLAFPPASPAMPRRPRVRAGAEFGANVSGGDAARRLCDERPTCGAGDGRPCARYGHIAAARIYVILELENLRLFTASRYHAAPSGSDALPRR